MKFHPVHSCWRLNRSLSLSLLSAESSLPDRNHEKRSAVSSTVTLYTRILARIIEGDGTKGEKGRKGERERDTALLKV